MSLITTKPSPETPHHLSGGFRFPSALSGLHGSRFARPNGFENWPRKLTRRYWPLAGRSQRLVAARFASTPVVMLIELLRSPSLIELMIGFRRLYGKTRMQEEPTSPFAFSGSVHFMPRGLDWDSVQNSVRMLRLVQNVRVNLLCRGGDRTDISTLCRQLRCRD